MQINGQEIDGELFYRIYKEGKKHYRRLILDKIGGLDINDLDSDLKYHSYEDDNGDSVECEEREIVLEYYDGTGGSYQCGTCGWECEDHHFEKEHQFVMQDEAFKKIRSKAKFEKYVKRLKSV
jgi:hypothetical protein